MSIFRSRRNLTSALALSIACVALSSADADAKRDGKGKPPPPAAKDVRAKDLPRTIVISLKKQRLTIFKGTRPVASTRISSGKAGHRTPKGVFSILQKRRRHYSNLYAGASMPNMQRLTWSGIALHAGHVPGYPASHGCIRLPYGFSRKLFSMTSMGDRVIVTDGQPQPALFSHANLIKPLPPGDPDTSTTEAAETEKPRNARLMSVSLSDDKQTLSELHAIHEGPMTRASVAAARERHLQKLTTLSEEAQAWAKQAGEKLKAATLKLRDIARAPRQLKNELAKVRIDLRRRESEERDIENEMRAFILTAQATRSSKPDTKPLQTAELDEARPPRASRTDAAPSPVALPEKRVMSEADVFAALEAQESDIEGRLMAKIDEIAAIRTKAAELQTAIDGHDAALKAAITSRDILKERYVAARKHFGRLNGDLKRATEEQKRYQEPITILISRYAKKLYVRQDRYDLLQADIDFANPDQPVGTHVLTAMAYNDDETDLVWKATTTARGYTRVKRPRGMSRKEWQKLHRAAQERAGDQSVADAIARLKISDAVRTRLSELIKPGSTIMISDSKKSLETGKYTDLIVEF